jgi:hypothetical protein
MLVLGILFVGFGMVLRYGVAPESGLKGKQDQCNEGQQNGATLCKSHTYLSFLAETSILPKHPQAALPKKKKTQLPVRAEADLSALASFRENKFQNRRGMGSGSSGSRC